MRRPPIPILGTFLPSTLRGTTGVLRKPTFRGKAAMAACNEPFHISSPSDFCGGCLTQKALGRRSAPLGKQSVDRQRTRPHFSGQLFRVGRMPARSPSVKPPDAASSRPAADARLRASPAAPARQLLVAQGRAT